MHGQVADPARDPGPVDGLAATDDAGTDGNPAIGRGRQGLGLWPAPPPSGCRSRLPLGEDPLVAGVDYDGNKVPFVPEFSGALGVRYDFESGFYAQTSVRMNGATYFDEANNKDFRQGSYASWDAEFGYVARNFSVALFGRNLLDEEYYTFINPQIQAGSPGDPQCFGIRATLEF